VPKRLAQQLILSLTLIVIVVEGSLGYMNIKSQERQLLLSMIQGADQLSKGITSATWHAMLADNRGDAYEVMKTIAEKQGIHRIRMYNRDGRVMFSTKVGEQVRVDRSAEVCSLCHSAIKPKVSLDAPFRSRVFPGEDGKRKLFMATPIYNEAACSQAACHAHPSDTKVLGVLDLALNLDSVDREVAEMRLRVLFVTATQILLTALFIAFFTRRFVTRPIRKLIEGTRAISAMQLDKPIEIRSSEELDELARSFNTMRERLNQAMTEVNQVTQSLESKVEKRTEELKTAHRKLLQTDRMASLGQLAASVAHEINNPISGVLNLSMLMQRILKDDGIPPNRIADFRKYLSQVISETSRVGRIVTDLLSFSRRSKPQSTNADLNTIVRNTISLVSHKLKLANVVVHLDLQEDLPLLRCDNSQMQQVVLNLVMNGAEATHKNGRGDVWVVTRLDPETKVVVLEVRDDGEGIPPEITSKIFDPFFTTKEEGKGVGLGLAVVYGIVDAHRGDIEVKSAVGKGAVFTVTLPLASEENRAPEKAIRAEDSGRKA
jgi:two-component system, NtrC family, sensor kinase